MHMCIKVLVNMYLYNTLWHWNGHGNFDTFAATVSLNGTCKP